MVKDIQTAITAAGCLNGLWWLKSDEAQNMYDLIEKIEETEGV